MATTTITTTVDSTVYLDTTDTSNPDNWVTIEIAAGGAVTPTSGEGVVSRENPGYNHLNIDSGGSVVGASGGVGVDFSAGGGVYNNGSISGGAGAAGATFGTDSAVLQNDSNGTITGGAGADGADFSGGAYLSGNSGTITGGAGGGTGAMLGAGGSEEWGNGGTITGGDGGAGIGGLGAVIETYGINNGFITGADGLAGGGDGLHLTGGAYNNGTIMGGNGTGPGSAGGVGEVGGALQNHGTVMGGDPANGIGGDGVLVNGGYFDNFGTVAGGMGSNGQAEAINFGSGTGTFINESGATISGDIGGLQGQDSLQLKGVSGLRETGETSTSVTYSNATFSVTFDVAAGETLSVTTDASGNSTVQQTPACYAAGTHIKTPRGNLPIEQLQVGDEVVVLSGEARPVRWIGYRTIDCSRHPRPQAVWPVCISADAFAEGSPSRDLWVSPGHAVMTGGCLIPACRLINGVSVRQIPRSEVEYWHIELQTHDVVLAEDLPSETYLDTGNRSSFANGANFVELHPDFSPKNCYDTCHPLVLEGSEIQEARRGLLSRVEAQGFRLDRDPAVYARAGETRVEPLWLSDSRLTFVLPANSRDVVIHSRTLIPAHQMPESDDVRELGICVTRLQLDGDDVHLETLTDHAHWHELEQTDEAAFRWSTGTIRVPDGVRLVVIDLSLHTSYRIRDALAAVQNRAA